MKIQVPRARFKKLLAGASQYCSEIQLEAKNNTISHYTMDPCNVCMIYQELPATIEEEGKIGLDLAETITAMNKIPTKDHMITLESEETKKDHFRITISTTTTKITLLGFEIEERNKIPEIKAETKATITFAQLQDIITITERTTKISAKKDHLLATSEDTDIGTYAEHKIPLEEITGEGSASYSTEYLEKLVTTKNCFFNDNKEKIELEWDTNYPLRITQGNNWMILAPRVEE